MNGNRNRYTSAPLYGIKNKKPVKNPPARENPPVQNQEMNPAAFRPSPYPPQQSYPPTPPPQQSYNQNPQQPYYPNPQQPYSQLPPSQQPYPQNSRQNFNQGSYFDPGAPHNPYSFDQSATTASYQSGETQFQPAPKKFMWFIPIITLVLPILFILSLIFSSTILRGVFLVLSLAAVIFMWAGKLYGKSARYTMTLIYSALCVIVGVALIISLPAPEKEKPVSHQLPSTEELFGGNSGLSSNLGETTDDFVVENNVPEMPLATDAPAASPAEVQLITFMNYWMESQLDSMVNLCLPAWVDGLENPKTELFILLANRTPVSYTVESVSGSDADSSRTVTLTVLIDKKSTTQPSYYQMQVLMLRINDNWYVDPNSLGGTKLDNTPHPGAPMPGHVDFVPTEAPAVTPVPETPSVLYYNPDGGQFYHADPNCPLVDKEYLPLEPFNYTDLNTTKFKNLLPCSRCHAPLRPPLTGQ